MRRALLALSLVVACKGNMAGRPAQRPLGKSAFFDDRSASRPLMADVVARSDSVGPTSVGRPAEAGPHTVERGREQYKIFCAPCHGANGEGDGVIVQHGFPRPPDLVTESPQDVINAITYGKGAMYSVPEADAQSIALYIQSFRR